MPVIFDEVTATVEPERPAREEPPARPPQPQPLTGARLRREMERIERRAERLRAD